MEAAIVKKAGSVIVKKKGKKEMMREFVINQQMENFLLRSHCWHILKTERCM